MPTFIPHAGYIAVPGATIRARPTDRHRLHSKPSMIYLFRRPSQLDLRAGMPSPEVMLAISDLDPWTTLQATAVPRGQNREEDGMRTKTGMLFIVLSSMIVPAAAQDAKSLLQAADKAIGASAVNSVEYSGTGWMGA